MKFMDLYSRIINLWPETIDISDGYTTENGGVIFPTLSKIHDNIEGSIDHKEDHWGNIALWSFFQAFHETAKYIKNCGGSTLKAKDVSKELIDKNIQTNLQPPKTDDCWAEHRKKYQGLA